MGKVFMSLKGKDTTPTDWQELPGFNYYGAQHIFEDPINAKRIYVTSVGGGTWSLLKDE
jgi:hypothetical protein